jgi:hypothetical protein
MAAENFALAEFLHSDTALSCGIENLPTWEEVENLAWLADKMEKIRAILEVPVTITSGFRCTALNAAVGGVSDSAHLFGCACDFVAPDYGDITDIIQALQPAMIELEIDQLIHEGDWVHLGLAVPPAEPRHQCFHV